VDIRNAVIEAITGLVIEQSRYLLQYRDRIKRLIESTWEASLPDDDGFAPSSQQLAALVNIFKLIKEMFKRYPDLVPDSANLLDCCLNAMETPLADLFPPVAAAALYGSLRQYEVS
jgi:hypothetical protein